MIRTLNYLAILGMWCTSTAAWAQSSGSQPANHSAMHAAQGDTVRTVLTGPLGSRSPSGTARMSGNTLRVDWTGDQPGRVRPWFVRRGSCSRDDGVVAALSGYAPIAVDATGNGSSSVTLGAPLARGSAFHVVVLESSADSTPTTLACGSLSSASAHSQHGAGDAASRMTARRPASGGGEKAMDHSRMDHAMMNHPDTNAAQRATSGAAVRRTDDSGVHGTVMPDSAAVATLRAIYERMMADPVIRERAMTDPVLQGMLEQLTPHDMSSMEFSMPGDSSATKPAPRPTVPNATKPATKPSTKPGPKAAKKPAPPAMPGMDHSKMPKKPQPPV